MSTSTEALQDLLTTCVSSCTSRAELWKQIVGGLDLQEVLELGVWRGEFAAHLLAACPLIQHYTMIDAWRPLPQWNKPCNADTGTFEHAYRETIAKTLFAAHKITILRGTTLEMIDRIPDHSLDFVYLDGDHTLRGIAIDSINVYPKIKIGGFLSGDDLTPSIWQHASRFEPTLVFPFITYFAEAVGGRLFALPFHQYLLRKPPPGQREFCFVDLVGDYGRRSLLDQLSLRRLMRSRLGEVIPRPVRRGLRALLGLPG